MLELKLKLKNLKIPLFIKNSIVEVYSFTRNVSSSTILMEALAGTNLENF